MASKKPSTPAFVDQSAGIALEQHFSPYSLKSSDAAAVSRCRRINPNNTRGSDRLPFERDRDRIIHSRPFRKLAGKTQLLIAPNRGDLRTRLTHTMAVYQVATSIARRFNLNLPATEAMALGHDVGHTPFGHAGEHALNDQLWSIGGFHHAAHSIRSLDHCAYDNELIHGERTCGLNLTTAVRQGIFHHGWFLLPATPYHLPPTTEPQWDLANGAFLFGSLEAQAVALADQIAYLNHDLDDLALYGFSKILSAKQVQDFFARHPARDASGVAAHEVRQEFLRLLKADASSRTRFLIRDATDASKARIDKLLDGIAPASPERTIDFGPVMKATRVLFYLFFKECIYTDVRIRHKNDLARSCVLRLHAFFEDFFLGNAEQLPLHVQHELAAQPPWWNEYFKNLDSFRNANGVKAPADSAVRPDDDRGVACRLAAADIVADLTDQEAILAMDAVSRVESSAGGETIDRILASFPSEDQIEAAKVAAANRYSQLERLFPVVGS